MRACKIALTAFFDGHFFMGFLQILSLAGLPQSKITLAFGGYFHFTFIHFQNHPRLLQIHLSSYKTPLCFCDKSSTPSRYYFLPISYP
jgi:hypothetical protein